MTTRARVLISAAIGLIAQTAVAGTVVVTSAADSGAGSLRQAILDANSGACAAPCTITFGGTAGVLTIAPLSPFPPITAAAVRIAPSPPGRAWSLEISGANVTSGSGLRIRGASCSVSGVIINGFPGSGIVVEGAANALISSSILGLDPTGTQPIPNRQNGIAIVGSRSVIIDSNTIGGNAGNGVYAISSSELSFGLNVIGQQYSPQGSGSLSLGNGASGVFLQDVDHAEFYGGVIANNALAGVAVTGASSRIMIEHSSLPALIWGNGLLPIDHGFDGVTDQARPMLTRADVSNGFVRVAGQVRTTSNATVLISVFASDSIGRFGVADAKTYLSSAQVTTDATGLATFEIRVQPRDDVTGQWISATATTDTTSELSAPLRAVANDQNYSVTTTSDSGPGSLRQAILDANAGICAADFPCRIQFDLPSPVPTSGHYTIAPLTPLPPVTRSGITIDGANTPFRSWLQPEPPVVEINGSRSTPGPGLTISSTDGTILADSIQRLAINGFTGPGILIDATANSINNPIIAANMIGTDPTGTLAVPNSGDGIRVRGNVPFVHFGTYGSGNRLIRNLISGNAGNGVTLESGFFEFDTNLIGTDASGKLPLPNGGAGVAIKSAAQAHLEGNTVAFNRSVGIAIATTTADAFKAAIQNSIHSNMGAAIEQTPIVQPAPEITSVTYDPATQIGSISGTLPRVTVAGWTTTLDFFSSAFPESDGRGSGETPLYALGTLVDVGQVSFTATTRSIDLRGKRISATATPFIYEGWKGAPVDNIFGQGFRYGTTSPMSNAVPVVTAGCFPDRPSLIGPAGEVPAGATELRWNTAAGAASYNVWLRRLPGVPHQMATTSGDSLTISLEPGTYEWFVEAVFPNCPAMKSEALSLVVRSGRSRATTH